MNIRKNPLVVNTINAMQLIISNSGYATLDSRWRTENIAFPFNRLYIIESGTANLSTGEQMLQMETGKAYLLPAGLPCSYRCDKTATKIFFDFNLFQPNHFDLLQGFPQIAMIDIAPDLFPSLMEHYFGRSFADGLWIQNCIYGLLHAFHEKYGFASNAPTAYSAHVATAIDYIQEHLSARLRVDELAIHCFVSKTYLSEHFRKEVGMTIGRYIDQQLIHAAQRQLALTDMTIEKISNDFGFCNQFYFSTCFKKHCRISPLEYRKRVQQATTK